MRRLQTLRIMGYPEKIAVGLGPLLIVGVIMYIHIRNNIREIRESWVQNRCNPLYMPFASMIDPSVTVSDNFSNCTNLFAKSILDHGTSPIYFMFAMFQNVAKGMMGHIQQYMKYIVGVLNFILHFANTFFGKLFNSFSNFLGIFGRVRDLMKRITSAGWYSMFTISTIVSFGVSLFKLLITVLQAIFIAIFAIAILLIFIFPPLLFGVIPIAILVGVSYCFHPDTPVGDKTMKEVKIGDVISGSKVTGVFHVKCIPSVKLYEYNGVIVSGLHVVQHDSKWMYIKDTGCPAYIGTYPNYLVCLNTDSNRIQINGNVFLDYEEVSEEKAISEIEMLVWGKKINQSYSCGLLPQSKVTLKNSKDVCIESLKLGDVLPEGTVTGIVQLDASEIKWYMVDGSIVSGNQAVQKNGKTVPAKEVGVELNIKKSIAYQIFLDNKDGMFVIDKTLMVRDYPDSHDPDVLESIQNIVLASLNKK